MRLIFDVSFFFVYFWHIEEEVCFPFVIVLFLRKSEVFLELGKSVLIPVIRMPNFVFMGFRES